MNSIFTSILTVPKHHHRVWALLGHLATIGFPVKDFEMLNVYNGYDIDDYTDCNDVRCAMKNNGYKVIDVECYHKTNLCKHAWVVYWGLLSILRKVVDSGKATLILEDDAFFKTGFFYDLISEKWDNLCSSVGFESIRLAMLFWYDDDEAVERESLDDYWVKGSRSGGQIATIYTPSGADYLLNSDRRYPIEVQMRDDSVNGTIVEGVYSARENQCIIETFCNFDSRTKGQRDNVNEYFEHYLGKL